MSAIASWTVFCDAGVDRYCREMVDDRAGADTLDEALDHARQQGWNVIDRYNTICPVCTRHREEKARHLSLVRDDNEA